MRLPGTEPPFFPPFIHRRGHFDLLRVCAWVFYCCRCLLCPAFYPWHQRSRTGTQWKQRGSFGLACLGEQKQPGCKHGGDTGVSAMSVLPTLLVALASSRDAEGRRGASRFPPGPQPGSRLPAGEAVETAAFQGTGLKAERSKKDQSASDWGIGPLTPFATSSKVSQPCIFPSPYSRSHPGPISRELLILQQSPQNTSAAVLPGMQQRNQKEPGHRRLSLE